MSSSHASEWFKSSYSQQNGECVDARRQATGIDVRDSKNPRGPVIEVGATAWKSFLAGADVAESGLPRS
jgi:hypothetical protein